MIRKIFFCLCLCGTVFATLPSKMISVNNRVLATVRGQVITVMDVTKRLDMLFFQQFPEHRSSTEARFEFYKANWKRVFEDLVDRQLILAWAEDRQFQVSSGDIREELEEMFGPNTMMNVYEAGLSIHEVWEMMRADILMRRALGFYVQMPVMSSITPEVLRGEYTKLLERAEGEQFFVWKSVSFKAKEGVCTKQMAKEALERFKSGEQSQEVEWAVSPSFRTHPTELSPQVQELFATLGQGQYSEVIEYSGRSGKGWKSYMIEKIDQGSVQPFSEVETALREQLASPEMERKTREFFADLRKQYRVSQSDEQITAFEPFSLQIIAA